MPCSKGVMVANDFWVFIDAVDDFAFIVLLVFDASTYLTAEGSLL